MCIRDRLDSLFDDIVKFRSKDRIPNCTRYVDDDSLFFLFMTPYLMVYSNFVILSTLFELLHSKTNRTIVSDFLVLSIIRTSDYLIFRNYQKLTLTNKFIHFYSKHYLKFTLNTAVILKMNVLVSSNPIFHDDISNNFAII